MTARELSFVHAFRPATAARLPPVQLLHRATAAPGAPMPPRRGQRLENGVPRVVRRSAEAVAP